MKEKHSVIVTDKIPNEMTEVKAGFVLTPDSEGIQQYILRSKELHNAIQYEIVALSERAKRQNDDLWKFINDKYPRLQGFKLMLGRDKATKKHYIFVIGKEDE